MSQVSLSPEVNKALEAIKHEVFPHQLDNIKKSFGDQLSAMQEEIDALKSAEVKGAGKGKKEKTKE